MKTINILAFIILVLYAVNTNAQESVEVNEKIGRTFQLNGSFGVGTFATGENMGGSAFLGSSLSADWIPNPKTVLTYGIESGILGDESNGNIIYGIPAIFRFGWHPAIIKNEKLDFLFW